MGIVESLPKVKYLVTYKNGKSVITLQCMLCAYKIFSFINHHSIFHMLMMTFSTVCFKLRYYVFICFKENMLHFYPRCTQMAPPFISVMLQY